jgi:hypothetical protein
MRISDCGLWISKPYGYTADEIRLVIREAAKSGMGGGSDKAQG